MKSEYKLKPMFLSFEAICRNVIDAWGNEHTELATGYEKSSFTFLGVTVNVGETPGLYLAHFQVNSDIFDTPLYWETTISNVTLMIVDLSKVITGSLSQMAYLDKYNPKNKDYKTNDVYVLDPEGFILYTVDPDTPELLYSKIKTPEYYIAHKLDIHKVNQINLDATIFCDSYILYYPFFVFAHILSAENVE